MTNVNATAEMATPSTGKCMAYVTGAVAAQNDTITVTNMRKILCVMGSMEPSSGDTVPVDCDIDDTTKNMINSTGSDVGTAHLVIIGIPK